jgi:hypothetical protein
MLNGTKAKPEPAALMHALRSSPSLHPTTMSDDGAPPKYQEATAMHATAATAATPPISCKRGMITNGENTNDDDDDDAKILTLLLTTDGVWDDGI